MKYKSILQKTIVKEENFFDTTEVQNTVKKEVKALKKKIAISKQKKEKSIASRVPDKTYFELEKESKELGFKTVSAYLRNIVENRKKEIDGIKLLEYKVYLMLNVSNNINQIAKKINTDMVRKGEINHVETCNLLQQYLINFKVLIEE